MTPQERRNPKVLDARRKRRIASGSGTKVEDINKLVKMHRQMADMMKSLGKNKGMLNKLVGGGRGAAPSEAEMAAMQDELARLDPRRSSSFRKISRMHCPRGDRPKACRAREAA